MVLVATATETAAAGAPTTALGIGADGIAFTTAAGAATTAIGTATSATRVARTAWHFGRGVAHIVQYLPPLLLEEAHAPHSQLEAEEEKAMMGWLCMLVVRVVCAGCVCCTSLMFC
jgi:hypothetical protein